MSAIFDIIAVPFGYVMEFIYSIVGDYGLSIILFCILTKLVMLPFSIKSKRSMMQTQRLQPKLQALQKKYGSDKERYGQEVQKLYEAEGVSPMAGCGTMLLTFPIMIGLYYVISQPLSYVMHLSAEQIAALAQGLGVENSSQIVLAQAIFERFDLALSINPGIFPIDYTFLGLNLANTATFSQPSLIWIIPILSGVTSYLMAWVQKKMQPPAAEGATNPMMGGGMMIMMPLMSVYMGFILPAGLVTYWVVNNIISAAQEYLLTRHFQKKDAAGPGLEEPKPKKVKKQAE